MFKLYAIFSLCQQLLLNVYLFSYFSPWGLDSFISRDMKLGGEPDLSMLDVDIAAIEAELDRCVFKMKFD